MSVGTIPSQSGCRYLGSANQNSPFSIWAVGKQNVTKWPLKFGWLMDNSLRCWWFWQLFHFHRLWGCGGLCHCNHVRIEKGGNGSPSWYNPSMQSDQYLPWSSSSSNNQMELTLIFFHGIIFMNKQWPDLSKSSILLIRHPVQLFFTLTDEGISIRQSDVHFVRPSIVRKWLSDEKITSHSDMYSKHRTSWSRQLMKGVQFDKVIYTVETHKSIQQAPENHQFQ
jgi:hypothetical protein